MLPTKKDTSILSGLRSGITIARDNPSHPLALLAKRGGNISPQMASVALAEVSGIIGGDIVSIQKTQYENACRKAKQDTSVRVAVCLDFTASTSHVVKSFRDQSTMLSSLLRTDGNNADILPIAFHGPDFNASKGARNDVSWWTGLNNIGNGRQEPPIVKGLEQISGTDFFQEKEDGGLNFAVIATDEALLKDSGYKDAIEYLKKTKAIIIAILSNSSSRVIESYSKDLESDLPEKVFTICNVSEAAKLSADIISGIRDMYMENTIRALTSKTSEPQKSITSASLDKLLQGLTEKGHSRALITWNKETKLLK